MLTTITINKLSVYNEVAKTTSYQGVKKGDDESAYERIFTKDEDRLMLERYWMEASSAVTDQLKPFVTEVTSQSDSQTVDLTKNYTVSLAFSVSYDERLTTSVKASLFSFFVSYITSKWMRLSEPGTADTYAADAAAFLEDAMRKVYFKRRPRRVKPT